jgi:thiol-disulfide isomerase/thioredoxin
MIKKTAIVIAFFCFALVATAQQIPKLKMADVVKNFSNKNDTIYVINFWATFCKPCVAEIPGFIKITDKYKNQKVKLLLVSLDLPSFYPKKIANFAAKNNFKTNIAWLDETDADYFCPMIDEKWSGAIPATIIVNTKTRYKKFFEAELNGEEFEMELKKAMEENKTSLAKPKFFMPMNEVLSLKYYDNKNHACDEYEYSQVVFNSQDSSVFSIDYGEVMTVATIDNMKVVIVKKEKLFYTYSNLKTVLVKKGMKIISEQIIGYAALDLDGIMPSLDFYLNNEKNSIALSKNNFIPRRNNSSKDHSFDLVNEPE